MDKLVTQTRVDNFESNGGFSRIIGRANHELSTEIQITKKFEGQLFAYAHDNVYDLYGGEDGYRVAHFPLEYQTEDQDIAEPDQLNVNIDDFPINKCIEEMDFRPLPSRNALDISPSRQLSLLPYLCESHAKSNVIYNVNTRGVNVNEVDVNNVIQAPLDNTRAFTYHPTERGMFFVRLSTSVLEDEDDEKVIENSVHTSSDNFTANNVDGMRMVLKTAQQTLNLAGNVAAGDQLIGKHGIPMVQKRKLIDGVYRTVYRTEFENYVMRVRGKLFKFGADGAGEIHEITDAFAFLLEYNLEIGPFDQNGFSECRAVSFEGEDITKLTLKNGFFKMILWEPYKQSVAGVASLSMNNGGGVAQAAASVRLEHDNYANHWKRVALYLPQRRFAITARDVVAVNHPLNDAQLRSPLMNDVLTHFTTRTDAYFATQANDTSPGPACSILDQFDLLRYADRDTNDGLVANFYAQAPRDQFGGNPFPIRERSLDVDIGVFEPIWAFHVAANAGVLLQNRTRLLTGFRVEENTEMGKQLAYISALADAVLDPNTPVMFTMIRSLAPTIKNVGNIANNHGFTGLVLNNADPNARVLFMCLKGALAVGNGYVTITGPTCKYIYETNRYHTAAKRNLFQGLNLGGAAVLGYDNGAHVFDRIGNPKFNEFVNFVTHATNTFGAANGQGVGDVKLNILSHNDGYLTQIADPFYSHDAVAVRRSDENTYVSDEWLMYYAYYVGAGGQNDKNKFVYDELPFINGVRAALGQAPLLQPVDQVTGAPWVVPAGQNAGAVASYATFPEPAGKDNMDQEYLIIQAAHPPIYVLNPVPIYATSSDDWLARYAGVAAGNAQRKHLYEELFALNVINAVHNPLIPAIAQPNAWVIPAGADPTNVDSYATYPRADGYFQIRFGYLEIQRRNTDALFHGLNAIIGVAGSIRYLNLPDVFQSENKPICRGRITELEFTEPLLTMGGMSQFQPFKIMPMLKTFPPLIQDIELRTNKEVVVKYKGVSDKLDPNITLELTPQTGYEIQTYSQDSFDQNLKSLQKVDILHPKTYRYTKTFAQDADKKISFSSVNGPPDYVFITVKRVSEYGECFDQYPPVIRTLKLYMYNQNVETISQLDEVQLFNATRRNSNFRSNVVKNRDDIGAVFLDRKDFGNWSRYADFQTVDVFEGQFEFYIDTRSVVKPVLSAGEIELLAQQDYRVEVVFIYENHTLSGSAHNLKFWFN